MTEEKALTTAQPRQMAVRQLTSDVWQTIQAIAPVATAARMFGVTEEQAAVVMMTGYELGLPLSASFDVIYVAKDGKRVLRPKGALALVRQSGLLEKFDWTSTNDSATVTMKRLNGPEKQMTLTIDEAKKAGWKSAAWDTTPKNMLRWRLIGWLCDLLFPDVLLGLSIADDSYLAAEITPGGDVIEGTGKWIQTPVTPQQAQPSVDVVDQLNKRAKRKQEEIVPITPSSQATAPRTPEQVAVMFAELTEKWGADRIVKVYKSIPFTEEQILEAEQMLEADDLAGQENKE